LPFLRLPVVPPLSEAFGLKPPARLLPARLGRPVDLLACRQPLKVPRAEACHRRKLGGLQMLGHQFVLTCGTRGAHFSQKTELRFGDANSLSQQPHLIG
jgi:hypothetical protein